MMNNTRRASEESEPAARARAADACFFSQLSAPHVHSIIDRAEMMDGAGRRRRSCIIKKRESSRMMGAARGRILRSNSCGCERPSSKELSTYHHKNESSKVLENKNGFENNEREKRDDAMMRKCRTFFPRKMTQE